MVKSTDLAGFKIGKLTVIELAYKKQVFYKNGKSAGWKYYYCCQCECGNKKVICASDLISGHTQSCGCLKHQKRNIEHGLSKTRLYKIWVGIKQRCLNSNLKEYQRYGGRGIKICDEWLNDVTAFYNWAMANGYDDTLSIDRINNDGDYEPSNCRWTTQKEQNRNTSQNLLITYRNETRCRNEWAEILNIKSGTILSRYRRGLDLATGKKKED